MSEYYRVKPNKISPCPSKGIYITKEEHYKTVISALIFLCIYTLKLKFRIKKEDKRSFLLPFIK